LYRSAATAAALAVLVLDYGLTVFRLGCLDKPGRSMNFCGQMPKKLKHLQS
jgi:hypothetical protein